MIHYLILLNYLTEPTSLKPFSSLKFQNKHKLSFTKSPQSNNSPLIPVTPLSQHCETQGLSQKAQSKRLQSDFNAFELSLDYKLLASRRIFGFSKILLSRDCIPSWSVDDIFQDKTGRGLKSRGIGTFSVRKLSGIAQQGVFSLQVKFYAISIEGNI